MDKIKAVIEEKYYWRPEYKIALDWAELALEQGSDPIQVISFIIKRLFSPLDIQTGLKATS